MRDIQSRIPAVGPPDPAANTEGSCRLCGGAAAPYTEGWVSVTRGSTSAARGGRTRSRRYQACDTCGHIQCAIDDLPDSQDERERYDEHHNTLEDHRYREYLERFLTAAVAPFVPPGGRILDFGSGPTPALTHLLAAAEYDPVPYDPFYTPEESALASPAGGDPLPPPGDSADSVDSAESAADAGGAAPARPRYDAIVALEVVEHLHYPGRELERLLTLLRPGGIFAVRTGVYTGEEEFLSWWYRRDITHVSFWTAETIGWIAGRWGLSVAHREAGEIIVFEKNAERNEVRL